ncbi:ATP-dependent DNA helicase PIF1-like protein [Tanacetum coccineum]
MLHGPCAKDARYAPCNVEGKCSKHFPKPIYEESIIDQDGYPIYRQRDDKLYEKGKVSMFTDWFALNERYPPARAQTYAEIPQYYVWYKRLKMWKPRKQRKCIGRIVYLTPASGIASLLLPAGRTAHNRFVIPLELLENNICGIKRDTHLAELMQEIVVETYPNFIERQKDDANLRERAILTPRNDDANAINAYMFDKLEGESITYNSVDKICKASTYTLDQRHLYLIEFLNTLNFPGMPPHVLRLKKELPIMLLRNVNPSQGLYNGTRLIITELGEFVLKSKILTGSHVGDTVLIHRIILTSTQSKWPFILKRRQYSVRPCYAMMINKSQRQSLNYVGLYLPNPMFSHGQLYVALSRVTNPEGLKKLMIKDNDKELKNRTWNIVYKEVFSCLT